MAEVEAASNATNSSAEGDVTSVGLLTQTRAIQQQLQRLKLDAIVGAVPGDIKDDLTR